jgi:undecaprenyl-diphosphatase
MAGQKEERLSGPKPKRNRWVDVREVRVLAALLAAAVCAWAFIELAEEVLEGETQAFDEWVLQVLRRPDGSGLPRGPNWLLEAGRDITALGGPAVLLLVTSLAVGYLLLQRQYTTAGFVSFAVLGGWLLCLSMKLVFARERPAIETPLVWLITPSFPSGHAKLSAVVYLSLGVLLARAQTSHPMKLYVLGVAALLTFLVGISRVYLGVHYPTDVVAGWVAGLAWTLPWWAAARYLQGNLPVVEVHPGPYRGTD